MALACMQSLELSIPKQDRSFERIFYSLKTVLHWKIAFATNMGSKISLLVYQFLMYKLKIWHMNTGNMFFYKFSTFKPKLAQI